MSIPSGNLSSSRHRNLSPIAQKINYAALNDGSGDESNGDEPFKSKFSSDEEDDFLDNTGADSLKQQEKQPMDSSDMFDSLKEDSPVKQPAPKRKLGAKAEVVKPPSKRAKATVNLDSSADSPIKVNASVHSQGM